MKENQYQSHLLLNHIFIASLLLLLVNDHTLKYQFPGAITGKLSDIAGIILLPMLIAYLFPRTRSYATLIAAALFSYWKSPFSQPLIELYNQFSPVQTSRIIDYSDLYVLLLLPISHYLIKNIHQFNAVQINKKIHPIFLLLPAAAILIATSPPEKHYYTQTDGNLSCYGCNITVSYDQPTIIQKLKKYQVSFDQVRPLDSAILARLPHLREQNAHYYRIDQLILEKDTLKNLDFTMKTNKKGLTTIFFNGMQVDQDLSDTKLETKLRRHYRKLIFENLKQQLSD